MFAHTHTRIGVKHPMRTAENSLQHQKFHVPNYRLLS